MFFLLLKFPLIFPILLKNVSGHVTSNFDGDILYHEPANSIIFEIKGFYWNTDF